MSNSRNSRLQTAYSSIHNSKNKEFDITQMSKDKPENFKRFLPKEVLETLLNRENMVGSVQKQISDIKKMIGNDIDEML